MGLNPIDEFQRALCIRDRAQRVEQVPAVEADLHILSVARDLADVMRLADGGDGAEIRRILAEFEQHRTCLFGEIRPHTFDESSFSRRYRQLDRLVLRQDAPPVQEFTLQQTADQRCLADGEEDMLAAKEERAGFVRIVEDFSASFSAAAGTTNLSVRPIGSSDFQRRSASR